MSNMTKQEILQKAFKKAIENGYSEFETGIRLKSLTEEEETYETLFGNNGVYDLIFSHEFAKAFWGEGELSGSTVYDGQEWEITLADGRNKYLSKTNWQYHLQQMVLEEDPIKYLEQFI